MRPGEVLHRELSDLVVGHFHQVYNELGYGFVESVYEFALAFTLTEQGIGIERQKAVQVQFRGRIAGEFRVDLLVDQRIVVELKCCDRLNAAHEAQLVHYLRASELELGYLLNFGRKPEFRRILYTNDRKILLRDRWEADYCPRDDFR